jgi:O-antigen/teichoic acid export membrane protein
MSRLSHNVIANYFGSGWVALMSFLFVPVYIHFLGIDTYGLIGFFVSFQALLALLDVGLGAAINRELARLSVAEGNDEEMRHLLRTMEWIYWAAAIVIALIVLWVSPLLASHWLHSASRSTQEVQQGIVLMGLAFAARWPFALYSGALMGLQQQVVLNALRIGIETLRSGGAALVLWLVAPTLAAFLVWQFVVGLAGSLATARVVWARLPAASCPPRFQVEQLRRVWRFAAGMGGVSVTVVILTQADKIVLSKLLSLTEFGYYMLAWAVAGGLTQLITPVVYAFLPRLTQVVAQNEAAAVGHTYHLGAQWMAAIILPVGIVLAVFSRDVLEIWTQSAVIAERSHAVMSIVLVGTCLNGLMNMPYALQLAYGWTRLALLTNIVAAAILVPLVVLAATVYGMEGAAAVWVVLNLGYMLVPLQLMHTRLLRGEKRNWYLYDVLLPSALAVAVAGGASWISPAGLGWMATLAVVFVTMAMASALCLLAMPVTRQVVRNWIAQRLAGAS